MATTRRFETWLHELIEAEHDDSIRRVETFEDQGMLTRDRGLVVRFNDGSEIQLTLVQSRRPINEAGHDRMAGEPGDDEAACDRCGALQPIDDFDMRQLDGVCDACLRDEDEDDGSLEFAARVNGIR